MCSRTSTGYLDKALICQITGSDFGFSDARPHCDLPFHLSVILLFGVGRFVRPCRELEEAARPASFLLSPG